jgi:hypothetical protein
VGTGKSGKYALMGPAPLRWRAAVVWPTPAQPSVLHADVRAVTEHTARRGRVDQARRAPGTTGRWHPVGDALQAWRGVPCTVASTRGAAMGDGTRCEPPSALLHVLGGVPSASASGQRRHQGGRPHTGTTQARRVLVAGAGASRSPAQGSRPCHRRRAHQPTMMQAIRWPAHGRRCPRSHRLVATGHHAKVVTVALARALGGGVWAMATEGPGTRSRPADHVRDHGLVRHPWSRCAHGQEQSRSPGVVEPSAA